MKILLCFGTRPEAIKMAPVLHELKKKEISIKVCVTAQHREMLDQVLEFFEIQPDHDLNLMKAGQSLNQLGSNLLYSIDRVLEKEGPDLVLVHGDTTTSALVALAAFQRNVRVGHIEAGLRTYNKHAPFPEEINRQITGRIADVHFAPTSKAKENLLKERILEEHVFITGNTVVDAIHWGLQKIGSFALGEEATNLKRRLNASKKMILVTGHRRENFGQGLRNICEALLTLAEGEEIEILFPVHMNPNVREEVYELLSDKDNILLISPVSYPTMLWLMQQATFIISDSGGIQEEAPTFKKPVLVTREISERMEGVETGFSILVGKDKRKIVFEASRLLENPSDFHEVQNPFGDGKASEKIVSALMGFFKTKDQFLK